LEETPLPTKQRKAAQGQLAADSTPQASPFAGNVPHFSQPEFRKRFDAWLLGHEKDKPFHEIRELEDRIKKGELKLRAAEQRGVSTDDTSYKAAVAKLAELRARRAELTDIAQIPFLGFNEAHNVLRATRGWGLPLGSYLEINIPGKFAIRVDISESEIPF